MKSITESVKDFLHYKKIEFEPTNRIGVFEVGFVGANGCFTGYIDINEEHRRLCIWTLSPVNVPAGRRQQAAELLMRINQRLLLGNSELDMDVGMVAYKTSVIVGRSELHNEVTEHLLFSNWLAINEYFPAIKNVISANLSPKQAIEKIDELQLPPPQSPDDTGPDGFLGSRLGDILGGSMN